MSARLLACLTLVPAIAVAQTVTRAKTPISVGPLVQVSKAFSNQPHYESLAAGDPDHPGRMITCSTLHPLDTPHSLIYQYCYVTFDGGKTWDATLKSEVDWGNQDPAAIYGRGDTVYVASLIMDRPNRAPDPNPDKANPRANRTVIFRSADGGRTWTEAGQFQMIDREFVNVDRTSGKFGGRLYNVGQGGVGSMAGVRSRSAVQVMRSLDAGRTWIGPVSMEYPEGATIFTVGTGGVLSTGTYVALFGLAKPGRSQSLEESQRVGPNAELHVLRSTTGGESFTTHKIMDVKLDRGRSDGSHLDQLAVDPGSLLFKDRIYIVTCSVVDNRIQIAVSYSSDEGKTWSKPVLVNDDRSPEDGAKGPDHILPSIGVNKDGAVLVTWYDRRNAKDNLGWQLRASTSVDGGDTWSASVPVTDQANSYTSSTPWHVSASGGGGGAGANSLLTISARFDGFFFISGHTTGMAVDADGTFHPTWHSNNGNGVMQLWTASIKVNAPVTKHGGGDLEGLDDISKSVVLEMRSGSKVDRGTGRITMLARLKNNTASDTIVGPVKIRVQTIESALGVPEIVNADNGERGSGAVWDFTSTLSGPLASWQMGAEKTLVVQLNDIRSLGQGRDTRTGLFTMDARVFGKVKKGKPSAEEKNP